MSDNFAAVGLLLAFAVVLPIVVMAIVHLLAPHKPHKEKLIDLCGMDLEDHLEVVYQLSSLRGPQRLRIVARVERENPVINSVTQLWKGSDFLEREAFDMFGLQFRGHPNLKRIYMWDDFEGYPMRKDYVIESHEQRAVMRVRKEGE
ncbi:NADH-quinone oxidoreductase subunit C [Desulfosporosinus sp. BICA1-9]|uniref:NADH-quinone oxidoreductase subunit C n=1 Tax=Desulfosporosinus sp. BICA1-9 TaxID=1531958 RepID=UPI000B332403|nr:NADH-quinone oxidoreductase subunit C [Desulfosporosinus sp. BICA1-9]